MEGFFDLNRHLSLWLGSAEENNEHVENIHQKLDKEDNSTAVEASSETHSDNNTENKSMSELKSLAQYIYSTIHETSNKIIKVVEESSVFGEFNKIQEKFLKNNKKNTSKGFPPWLGCLNEEVIKAECLSLSSDRRNFLRNPPAGINFQFDYEASYPTALAIMEQDPNLVKMRYNLVPKLIKEKDFWRNYFYRVSLICRANELKMLSSNKSSSEVELFDRTKIDKTESSDKPETCKNVESLEESWEKELETELQEYTVIDRDGNKDELEIEENIAF